MAETLVAKLRAQEPPVTVVGHACPPFRPPSDAEDQELVDAINRTRPDIVWVGLGTPKQERWMKAHRPVLEASGPDRGRCRVRLRCGDVAPSAPWMQRNGLEWLFRLAVEPAGSGAAIWSTSPASLPGSSAGLQAGRPGLVSRRSRRPCCPRRRAQRDIAL